MISTQENSPELLPIEPSQTTALSVLLGRAIECSLQAGPTTAALRQRLHDLRQRLQEGRLQLAILGQFKRGKSSFVNALLGVPLLPTGILPLTSIPTFITWRSTPLIRVTYLSSRPVEEFADDAPDEIRSRLVSYVAEASNPMNRLGVARVDLYYPAPILDNGVVLIDTPGIGSAHRHNTDAALRILPECDAAFFVVSADPPLTEAELDYLEAIRRKVGRLFFVLNKADHLGAHDLETAVNYLRDTLGRATKAETSAPIFSVSALKALQAKTNGDDQMYAESGISAIEGHLLRYLTEEKSHTLRMAIARKASDAIFEVEGDLGLRLRALELPVDDLAKRSATLEEAFSRITAESRTMFDLLAGDRRRVLEQLETLADALRKEARLHLTGAVSDALSRSDGTDLGTACKEAITAALPSFFDQALSRYLNEIGRTVETALAAHQARTDDFVNLVRRTAADLFDVSYTTSAGSDLFSLPKDPYWITQSWSGQAGSMPIGLIDRLWPAGTRRLRRKARYERWVDELVQRNVENLRWAMFRGLDDTFRRFAATMQERLAAAISSTRGALAAARAARSAASNRLEGELAELRQVLAALSVIRAQIVTIALDVPEAR